MPLFPCSSNPINSSLNWAADKVEFLSCFRHLLLRTVDRFFNADESYTSPPDRQQVWFRFDIHRFGCCRLALLTKQSLDNLSQGNAMLFIVGKLFLPATGRLIHGQIAYWLLSYLHKRLLFRSHYGRHVRLSVSGTGGNEGNLPYPHPG